MNKRLIVVSVALVVIAIAGYGALVESAKKDPTVMGSVGTISVSVVPYPTSLSTDHLSITNNTPGTYDFSGWRIETDAGDSHVINAPAVLAGDDMAVCGEDVGGVPCTDYFDVINFFDNNAGIVTLYDNSGSLVSTFTYSAPEQGEDFTDAPDLITTIYSGNASIDFCRADNQGGYTTHQGNVKTIVGGKAHASPDSGSIIPSFFYNLGSGVGFYDGLAWPDQSGIFANGCS